MTEILGIGTTVGALGMAVLSVLYALAVRSGSRSTIAVGDLKRDLAGANGELSASVEQRKRLALTVARQAREIRELQSEIETLAPLLPRASLDALRARLDRVLSPDDNEDGADLGEVPRPAAGADDPPD